MSSPSAPALLLFDVNETLSDLDPLAEAFRAAGAPGELAPLWFTAVLRDGLALAAAGSTAPFAAIARDVARGLLHGARRRGAFTGDADEVVDVVLAAFTSLPCHPDVADGVAALTARGHRLATLSNGAASVGESLLARGGVRAAFERVLSVEQAGVWKPAEQAYRWAAAECAVPVTEVLMVAVHPWDLDGAARAGLRTAWIDRTGAPWPAHCHAPEIVVADLSELAATLPPGGTGS